MRSLRNKMTKRTEINQNPRKKSFLKNSLMRRREKK